MVRAHGAMCFTSWPDMRAAMLGPSVYDREGAKVALIRLEHECRPDEREQ